MLVLEYKAVIDKKQQLAMKLLELLSSLETRLYAIGWMRPKKSSSIR